MRQVSNATGYDYPIGTIEHGFNAVRMNFATIPAGGGLVKGKFNDGTDNPSGDVGSMSQACIGCTATTIADNNGYNRYFTNNSCDNNGPQWVVLEDGIQNHGYWSFASSDNNQNYSYSIEVFPNSFSMQGNNTDSWRTLKYSASYGNNPSAAGVNWSTYVDSVSTPNDLLQYTRNTGSCYTGQGVPGGIYTGFGQFSMKKSKSNNALPVKMIYVTATPQDSHISLDWATAIEINNSGFEVERSTDGANFTKMGFVAGNNNS
jgi:hypothetical protein